MSQAWKRVRKRDDEILNFHIKRLFGVDASGCADKPWQFFCACAVVFLPKWWSRQLWHHLMMSWGSLVCWREGTINGEHNRTRGVWLLLLLSSGCFDTSVRVFTKPQTLYLGCLGAPRVGSISWMYRIACFYHKHVSWPIWRTLSCYDFIYLTVTKVDYYLLP